ncbi:MAG: tandem-95 repeat protein [Chitinophagaceae bacterium]|nr:tandem-95 repeat protein [Chitinophagaceae bacterium]
MKKLLTFLSFGTCLLFANAIQAANYYLSSSDGNDSNTSTQAQNPATPWKSLDKLNSFFSSLRPGDSVLFKCGDIFYGKLVIGQSGNPGSPIVLASYGTGSKPVISGFTPVTSWTNIGGNIWESTSAVRGADGMLNMVTVNDNFQPVGRWPKLTDANSGYLNIDSHSDNQHITSSQLSGSLDYTGGEIVIRKTHTIIDRETITSMSGTTVTFSANNTFYSVANNYGFFFQNHKNACTKQNEWYYNTSTKKIGIYSTGTPSGIKVSTIDTVVDFNGRNYITIKNVSIIGANKVGLNIQNTSYNTVDACDISFIGVDGISGYAPYFTLKNSTISYANNNGLSDGASAITITNNIFSNIGTVAGMSQSEDLRATAILGIRENSLVQYNIIHDIGYIGIRFYRGNTTVNNNYIYNTNLVKDDGGAIYVGGGEDFTGATINYNVIINSKGAPDGTEGSNYAEGIYVDDGAYNVTMSNNTISQCGYGGIFTNAGSNLICSGNTIFDCRRQFATTTYSGNPSNLKLTGNIFVAKSSGQYTLYSQSGNFFSNTDYNYYCRPMDDSKTISVSGDKTLAEWISYSGQDAHSKKSPKTITDPNDLRFEYNATQSPKTINLGATYIDVTGKTYNGSVTLQPYTSVVLIYQSGTVSNQTPVANAGPDQNFFLPVNSVTLNGSGSDADGSITSYQWAKISGPSQFTIVSPTQAQTVINNLVQGVYQFELTVTDNLGATGKDTVTVTVNPANNQPPTATAGVNQNITLPNNTVTLNGSGSDPDGSIASYQWTKISGPSQFSIVSPTQAQTVINSLVQGVYQFQLKVTDNQGATATSTVTITVNPAPNQPPTATAGSNQNITLPANSATLNGSGSDPDGSIASYQWTKISGPSQFTIVSPSQAQTVINGLVQGVYQFELTVTDNLGAKGKDTVTVTVNPSDNQLPSANAGVNKNITLPTNTVTLNGSGTDPDGSITSYQWTKISGPNQFNIVSPSQAQTVVNNLVQGVYQFQLTVTDNKGATATATVTVTVNPAPNQPPAANAGTNQNITLPNNTVTLNGSGTDPDGSIASYQWAKVSGPNQFNIVSPSQAQTVVNNLVQGVYQFQLTVTDNRGATATATVTVTVNPSPNQPPAANAGADQAITLPVNTITLSGSGTDPDGTIVSYSWSRIAGPSQFSIISPAQAQTVVNNLVQGVYVFQLTVRDNSGATASDLVTVTVNAAIPSTPPVANAGSDLVVVLPVPNITLSGSGSTTNGSITSYSWAQVSGPSQSAIVSPSYSQTSVLNLTAGVYLFELTVTDNKGLKGRDTVQVTVQNSVNRNATSASVKLYPNPATTSITIAIEGATEKTTGYIKIYTVSGNTVYQEEFTRDQFNMTKQIDVSNYANGVYFVSITIDSNTQTTLKFVKQ